ncbi:MAG: helix-turn-helix domain-containing protein [Defluviitaleaceae bacterium]|nr:helix-turn-helix domain-containing protein [Defluviitaleaceae bacterium]
MEQRYRLDYTIIGRQIKKVRKSQGLTQSQLADLSHITTNYIAKLETNRTAASLETMTNICNALKTDINILLIGEEVTQTTEYIDLLINNKLKDFTTREKECLLLIINGMEACKYQT